MKHFLLSRLQRAFTMRGRKRRQRSGANFFPLQDDDLRQMTFTFAVIALAAKLSQADGKVVKKEFLAFCELFPLPVDEHEKTHRLFMMACQDSLTAAYYAQRIVKLFPGRGELLRDLVARLCRLATADGPLQPAEREWLEEISDILGVDREVMNGAPATADPSSQSDPYLLLGVARKASFEEIKNAYRRRIRELHPDIMMARGSAPEDIARASGLLASINVAYGVIAGQRKTE